MELIIVILIGIVASVLIDQFMKPVDDWREELAKKEAAVYAEEHGPEAQDPPSEDQAQPRRASGTLPGGPVS